MTARFSDDEHEPALLDGVFPLDPGRPFTRTTALASGIASRDLTALVAAGLLRRVLEGVYVGAAAPDDLDLRVAALSCVLPRGAVVTDRTAAWLHGAPMALAPGDHLETPAVSAFHRGRGRRLRNELTASGQRMMTDDDVVALGSIRVTTPLRTACDLGRLLHRDAAFAALDSMLRLGQFEHAELLGAAERFRGYRGVRQLRMLAPYADPRAESTPESVMRLRWLDCPTLPRPELQVPVIGPNGATYRLDLGVEELWFGLEYDGEQFHGPAEAGHDERRRDWIEKSGWVVEVIRRRDLFGRNADLAERLPGMIRSARKRLHRLHI